VPLAIRAVFERIAPCLDAVAGRPLAPLFCFSPFSVSRHHEKAKHTRALLSLAASANQR
jgi:hypothetical protein